MYGTADSEVKADAERLMSAGHPADGLSHEIVYPDGTSGGLSNPLPPGSDLAGYIAGPYRTLAEWAGWEGA